MPRRYSGDALEIVDERGQVRASITRVAGRSCRQDAGPAQPDIRKPCWLRMINSQGRPNVKLAASEVRLGPGSRGESDPAHVQAIGARREHLREIEQQGRAR